jgi:hypothetical protein
MESYDILVTVLSITLIVFLVLSIVLLVLGIKVMNTLGRITDRAEHIADNVDAVGSFFKKTAGPVALGKLIANIMETFKKRKEGDDNE